MPKAHALALRLEQLGADAETIAECLGIGPEAVEPLLEVARAKLARSQTTPRRAATQEGGSR
jgi:hypothetical protein